MSSRPVKRVLYLAPWVDFGGSDKGTIDWFRWLDRDRFSASLITTQPSANRRIAEVAPFADEVLVLPDLMSGHHMPRFILDFIVSREIEVVHIMNSRLGFELLPDFSALPEPPVVVVQMHVEEEDRSGYVRLVTTRYGNLVDAFSVSSRHLAAAVTGYDVCADQIAVIPTGVDAETEFSPATARPHDLGPGSHVLYAGRLTAQKDPQLMVEVAALVAEQLPEVRFHVVGDGELEADVRAAVRKTGLADVVAFHPPTPDLQAWYAACHLLLMTSTFEGVPYVLYEAMAMGLPSVVPHLPGNAELLSDGGGILVSPRHRPDAYAAVVLSLLNGSDTAHRMGARARERILKDFSVGRMARDHSELYERLLAARPPRDVTFAPEPRPAPHRLPLRPSRGRPLVSVVIPCFNHGRYLPQTLDAIRRQDYPAMEIIVVDDASTDAQTLEVVAALRDDADVVVVERATNAGPSAARNAAIALAKGRYILPVDADNLLLPGAVAALVDQLQSTGEGVGYIYPNVQYFGNRHDYFEAPEFDLYELLSANYCDTCSLLDRSIFDAGFVFAEDIGLGHEDWDFFLTLAKHGIRGEPADRPTLRYRKTGFTRSDSVEYRATPFAEDMRARHPALYPTHAEGVDPAAAHRQEARLKAEWLPAISMILLEDVDADSPSGVRLLENLARQSMCDAEVIASFDRDVEASDGPFLRRVPRELPDRLMSAMAMARANYVVIVQQSAGSLVCMPAFFECLVAARMDAGSSVGIAFADDNAQSTRLPFDIIDDPPRDLTAFAVALFERFGGPQVPAFTARTGHEVASIVELLEADQVMQWRHAPQAEHRDVDAAPELRRHDISPSRPRPGRDERLRRKQRYSKPLLPASTSVRRWEESPWPAWIPPETNVLLRCREIGGDRRRISFGGEPPPGYELEYWLGAAQRFGPPGTARLEACLDDAGLQTAFRVMARESPVEDPPASAESLGYIETAPFPLLQALHTARVRATGEVTLVAGTTDLLLNHSDLMEFLGYVEAFPSLPSAPVFEPLPARQHPMLLRGIDGRRHRYGIEASAVGRTVGRLGRLLPSPIDGSIAAIVSDDGTFSTEHYHPRPGQVRFGAGARWTVAPLAWRGHGPLIPRGRASARRLVQAVGVASGSAGGGTLPSRIARTTIGYLYPAAGPGLVEIFSAVHPVTADQLLTPFPLEAGDMGYRDITSVGFTRGDTMTVHIDRYSAPWTSRFGMEARRTWRT
jgi:glycosyltransferase involved in cell wall biosynthesis